MKIRQKITLVYTCITFCVLLIAFAVTYLLTTHSISTNYNTYLLEKAYITAQKHFEQDEVSQQVYENILRDYSLLLPEAEEVVLDVNNPHTLDSLLHYFPIQKIKALYHHKTIVFDYGKLQGVGIYYDDNQGNFIILSIAENQQGEYITKTLLIILLIILLSAMLFVGLIGWSYAGRILSPIKHILKTVKTIGSNNLHFRLNELKNNDELSELIRLLNQMLERLEFSFNSQKMFISNASHELNSPLTAIMGECEVMQLQDFSPEEYKEALKRIDEEAQRLKNLVTNLLKLAQADLDTLSILTEDLQIGSYIWQLAEYFEKTKYKGRIILKNTSNTCSSSEFTVRTSRDMIWIALQNIIENACKYSGEKQVVITYHETTQSCIIIVEDQGIGIPPNELENIFQPFYRGSNTYGYQGFGVGLSLSERIIKLSGGSVSVVSEQGKMTRVIISWHEPPTV